MTAEEQIAILDGQLERGTDDFDEIILRERGTIRNTAKSGPSYRGQSGGKPQKAALPAPRTAPTHPLRGG